MVVTKKIPGTMFVDNCLIISTNKSIVRLLLEPSVQYICTLANITQEIQGESKNWVKLR